MSKPYIILSFTTFKARVNCLHTVLDKIAKQTVKPDEVRCYTELKINDFPKNIQKMLNVAKVQLFPAEKEDKGYKKILPVLKDFWGKNVIIIIIDDDWAYPITLVKDLINEHTKYPDAIISFRGRKIIKNKPYLNWPFNKGTIKRPHETMIHTGSGSLYMPNFFTESVFDAIYKTISPTADDLWITIQTIIAGTPVITLSEKGHTHTEQVHIPTDSTLYIINETQNDIQWKNLVQYANSKGVDVYSLIEKTF